MKFKVGDKAIYRRLNKVGTITAIIPESRHYYIFISGETWSVPEEALGWTAQ